MSTSACVARISRFYDRIGGTGWGRSSYFTFSARSPALRRWIAAQLPTTGARVLSVGCGTGELEVHLSKLEHQVIGIDLSQHMLKRARNRGLRLLAKADSQRLPFGPNTFDAVMFLECVGYLQLPAVFEEARRVLAKRGTLLLTTYTSNASVHAPYTKFSLNEITSSLSDAAFRIRNYRFLDPKRTCVTEAPSHDEATLLYIMGAAQ